MRNRNRSNQIAVFVADSGASSVNQIDRATNVNYSVDLAGSRQDAYVLGKLAPIARMNMGDISVPLSFDYYLTDGKQEGLIGLYVQDGSTNSAQKSAVADILEAKPKTYLSAFVLTVPEGMDAYRNSAYNVSERANHYTEGFGNIFLSEYSVEAAVGSIPTASVSFEGTNYNASLGSSGVHNPYVNTLTGVPIAGTAVIPTPDTGSSDVDVLKPGDIELDLDPSNPLGIGGSDLSTIHVQNFNASVSLSRTPLERIGSKFAYFKGLDTPIEASFSVSALSSEIDSGSLADYLSGCNDSNGRDISVILRNRCSRDNAIRFDFKNALLDSMANSVDVNGDETVDLQFSTIISASADTSNGLFISGSWR